jgi:hypothetical protein
MPAIVYEVHTATCVYLLDADGICRFAHGPEIAASMPPGVEECIGAQFVASLDLRTSGGLIGELRVGASALFVRKAGDHFVLLRTLPVDTVRMPGLYDPNGVEETQVLDGGRGEELPAYPLTEDSSHLDPVTEPEEVLDFEDLVSISVTEVTRIRPLYNPSSR